MWDGAIQGMNRVRQQGEQSNLANLSALTQLQGMQKSMADAEVQNAERQRQGAFRQEIAKLAELGQPITREQYLGAAMKHGMVTPKDYLANDLGVYKTNAAKEMSAAKIAAQSAQIDAKIAAGQMTAAQGREMKAILAISHSEQHDSPEVTRMLRGMLGNMSSMPAQSQPAPTAQPAAPQPTAPISSLGQPSAGPAPDVAPKLAGLNASVPAAKVAAAGILAREGMPNGGGAVRTSDVISPEMGPNEDMRDVMARQAAVNARNAAPLPPSPSPLSTMAGAPQAPDAATPAPAEPVMPTFTGSREQIAAKRNAWLLQQSKNKLASGKMAGDFTKTGDEFLTTLPEEDRSFVQKLANYDIDPKTLSTRGGEREKYLRMAVQLDPTYDQKNYGMVNNAINRFGAGRQGDIVRSLNVAVEHIDTARRLGEALQNKNLQVYNQLKNFFAEQTGKPAPTGFNAVKEILADEIVKGVIGNGAGALADREAAAKKVKDASSPAQLNIVLNTWLELMGGQIKGLEKQYEGSTLGKKDFRDRYLTPRAVEAINYASGKSNTTQNTVSDAPPGVDPKVWAHMSDEGKKLWK